jgi:transcriptional regulator with XRE-family HTH domain
LTTLVSLITRVSVDLDSFGKRLHYARTSRGLKARELARLAGLSESHPTLLESGRQGRGHVSADVASKLAKALEVSLEWLVNGGEAPALKPFASPATGPTGGRAA